MKFQLPIKFDKLENLDKNQSRTVVIGLLAVIVLMGVIAYLAFLLSLKGEEQVMVPDIRGLDLAQACVKLQVRELYPRVNLRTTADPNDAGKVLEQNPQQGMIVKAGRRIDVTVSRGTVVSKVESYIGQDVNDVRLKIDGMFINQRPMLVVVDPVWKKDAKIPAGRIIEQQPAVGTEITGPVQLKFIVSSGPENAKVTMPRIEGMTIADALRKVESSGIAFSFVLRDAAGKEKPGVVVKASVAAAASVADTEIVEITVTKPVSDTMISGLYSAVLPEYPVPVRTILRAVYATGEEVAILSVRSRGGAFTCPYSVPAGTTLIVSVSGRDLDRKEIK